MPQQDYYTRTLNLLTPNGRIEGGSSEATALDASTTADTKFVQLRCKSTATSGDTRVIYACLYMNGAGQAGEALRGRTVTNAATAGGVHGVHGGVECATSGTITGLAAGVRGTFMGKNAAHAGGSVCGGMSELWAEGTATDWGGYTNHAVHRFVVDGNATGKNTVDFVLDFALSGTGEGCYTNGVTNTTMLNSLTHAIKCKVNGTTLYLPFATAIA